MAAAIFNLAITQYTFARFAIYMVVPMTFQRRRDDVTLKSSKIFVLNIWIGKRQRSVAEMV